MSRGPTVEYSKVSSTMFGENKNKTIVKGKERRKKRRREGEKEENGGKREKEGVGKRIKRETDILKKIRKAKMNRCMWGCIYIQE